MSWFSRLAGSVSKSIFSDSRENKFLPHAPTIMAAGSQWYNSAEIQREDVLNRIVKDVNDSTDLYPCINVYNIADTIVGNMYLGNYGTYLRENTTDKRHYVVITSTVLQITIKICICMYI